ncbi:hypothetical protein [Arthrobacter sp. Z4-13]
MTWIVAEPSVTAAWDWNFPSSVIGPVEGAEVEGTEISVWVLSASGAGSE